MHSVQFVITNSGNHNRLDNLRVMKSFSWTNSNRRKLQPVKQIMHAIVYVASAINKIIVESKQNQQDHFSNRIVSNIYQRSC
jgi:hypothetical protein